MASLRRLALLACCVLCAAAPAAAVVVHPNLLLGNLDPEQAPPVEDDPGWERFGRLGTGGALYLGRNLENEHWVLTARHLTNVGSFNLDGVLYDTNGFVGFLNPDGSSADLRAWRVVGPVPLPSLDAIATLPPLPSQDITLLLAGRTEGAFSCWDAFWQVAPCAGAAHKGYPWSTQKVKRWATNRVSADSAALDTLKQELGIEEEIFISRFDELGTVLESQSTTNDSGGPVFVPDGNGWALAGVTLYIGSIPNEAGRPANTAIFEQDFTIYADLSYYRDQILDATGVVLPEPTGGLWLGAAFLAALARRRR